MGSIRFCGCGWQSEDPFVCFVRNLHKGLGSEISHETGRGRGKDGPWVKRRRYNIEVDRTGQLAGKSRRLLGCVDPDAGLANLRGWVSIPGDFVGISLEYTLAIAHRMQGKCHKLPPFLRSELTQVLVCLSSFLPPSRLCMLCFVCP